MIRYKYRTGAGRRRVHICNDKDMTLCKAENGSATLNNTSEEMPPNRKLCSTCRRLAKVGKRAKGKPPTPKDARLRDYAWVKSKRFLQSRQWRELRYQALQEHDGRCELCAWRKRDGDDDDGIVLNVDHIKPRSKWPELALKLNNLQVLCSTCNHGKGNWDDTDWREPSLAKLMGEEV